MAYVILCESYREAVNAFWIFADMVKNDIFASHIMLDAYINCICIDYDSHYLEYFFVDYRYRALYTGIGDEFFDVQDLFEKTWIGL